LVVQIGLAPGPDDIGGVALDFNVVVVA